MERPCSYLSFHSRVVWKPIITIQQLLVILRWSRQDGVQTNCWSQSQQAGGRQTPWTVQSTLQTITDHWVYTVYFSLALLDPCNKTGFPRLNGIPQYLYPFFCHLKQSVQFLGRILPSRVQSAVSYDLFWVFPERIWSQVLILPWGSRWPVRADLYLAADGIEMHQPSFQRRPGSTGEHIKVHLLHYIHVAGPLNCVKEITISASSAIVVSFWEPKTLLMAVLPTQNHWWQIISFQNINILLNHFLLKKDFLARQQALPYTLPPECGCKYVTFLLVTKLTINTFIGGWRIPGWRCSLFIVSDCLE